MKRALVKLARKILSHYNIACVIDLDEVIVVQNHYMKIKSYQTRVSLFEKSTCTIECESII